MSTNNTELSFQYAHEFVDFVNASPTPYHAVKTSKKYLIEAGFIELSEKSSSWDLKAGGKYFVTRNNSSIIAFKINDSFVWGEGGIAIVGAHTDSPCLRIKPISKKELEGFIQIGVEQYGGLIAHSWFDRDLSIAGRVYVNDKEKGVFIPHLIKIDKPLLRIPTLAIHLNRELGTKFEFNKETELLPIAGQSKFGSAKAKEEEGKESPHSCADDPELQFTPEQFESVQSVISRHNELLVDLIAQECGVTPDAIEDFELILYDHQKSTLGGLHDEFIFSPRLDNLTSCYCAVKGLVESTSEGKNSISMISLFDHEEIGSASAQGADSTFLPDIVQRILGDYFHSTVSRSFLLSSDMAHGVHPNYSSKYEAQNKPQINQGPVIKINANQRYATNSAGIVLLKNVGQKTQVPLQLFVVRNDSPCGSTIGPILAAKLGIRTLDLGNPQLSMHSIRETGGTHDILHLVRLFGGYFSEYSDLQERILVDGV
ncbi:uncharacterized protein KQ657_000220 [Scheffersomyces spartinae]|uniref:aspartyl aminopeptidase n=1 Tax=Scheffersomyces spartinae TaxID=45513 RepID=A0A9P7VE96_9ASCO|nr:uncharacterized protein KQ657_000220 [Scheffersomyces spartinae]KAG7196207.1 hypothetical protein KQ657_000220 [Scheffersomyces spartinae]